MIQKFAYMCTSTLSFKTTYSPNSGSSSAENKLI